MGAYNIAAGRAAHRDASRPGGDTELARLRALAAGVFRSTMGGLSGDVVEHLNRIPLDCRHAVRSTTGATSVKKKKCRTKKSS